MKWAAGTEALRTLWLQRQVCLYRKFLAWLTRLPKKGCRLDWLSRWHLGEVTQLRSLLASG